MSDYLPDMIEPPPPPEPVQDANVHIPDNIQDKLQQAKQPEPNQHDQFQDEDDNIQMELLDEEEPQIDDIIQKRKNDQ